VASTTAEAFWITGEGQGEIRRSALPEPGPGEVSVRALYGAISRGTEALVFAGRVPPSQYDAMRAPHQEGDFPWPVKYGYSNVGLVEAGPDDLRGRTVFCLHPHQSAYVVPADAAVPLPDGVLPARAVLAANMETAVNGLWDAAPRPRDGIVVVGAGVVGCLVAYLAAEESSDRVQLVDIDSGKAAIAQALGVDFASPDDAARDADIVIHASGAPEGLVTALGLAGFEATIVELSWYGDQLVPLPLGEAFHAKRLTLKSSQVGNVAPSHRADWSRRRRLEHALGLLSDPRLDRLFTSEGRLDELPATMARLAHAPRGALCHRIVYGS